MSAAVRTGRAIFGPSPASNSRPTFIACGIGEDVGEQDRRVEPVALERLQRHLAGELGVHAQLQEAAGLRARRAVLRQVAAGLAHHPQRRARRRAGAAARAAAGRSASGALTRRSAAEDAGDRLLDRRAPPRADRRRRGSGGRRRCSRRRWRTPARTSTVRFWSSTGLFSTGRMPGVTDEQPVVDELAQLRSLEARGHHAVAARPRARAGRGTAPASRRRRRSRGRRGRRGRGW